MLEVVKMVPDCLFDIYTPNSEVVRIVFGRNNIINSIIEDGGALYQANKCKYDVAITLSISSEINWLNLEKLSKKIYSLLIR